MSVPTQPVEGFYYDELSKIRALDPDIAGKTQELKDECKEFVDSKPFVLIIAHPLELPLSFDLYVFFYFTQ